MARTPVVKYVDEVVIDIHMTDTEDRKFRRRCHHLSINGVTVLVDNTPMNDTDTKEIMDLLLGLGR